MVMFIPPEAAVQFTLRDFPESPIWVYPTPEHYDMNEFCNCKSGFRFASWGSNNLQCIGGPENGGGTPVFCKCLGEIIE